MDQSKTTDERTVGENASPEGGDAGMQRGGWIAYC
jgi:hypothetical protein